MQRCGCRGMRPLASAGMGTIVSAGVHRLAPGVILAGTSSDLARCGVLLTNILVLLFTLILRGTPFRPEDQ
jgi:hypothetical protein